MNMKSRKSYKGLHYGKSATLKINTREQQRPTLYLLRDLCLVSRELMVSMLLLRLPKVP